MGYWQKESEFGKKVGCFKAPLGSLGLKLILFFFQNKRLAVLQQRACHVHASSATNHSYVNVRASCRNHRPAD